jgi:hypothetical protein
MTSETHTYTQKGTLILHIPQIGINEKGTLPL